MPIPLHWQLALNKDENYQNLKRIADRAYMEYSDLKAYDYCEYLRLAQDKKLLTMDTVMMFGEEYHDAELGAMIYESLKDYERKQLALQEAARLVCQRA